MLNEGTEFDFIIVGSGITGSMTAFLLSQQASCLLLDAHPTPLPYHLVKVFPEHNFVFVPEIPKDDLTIFPADHRKSVYASSTIDAPIDSMEFGQLFGKMMDQFAFVQWFLDHAQQNGTIINWYQKVIKTEYTANGIQIIARSSEDNQTYSYSAKVLLLATGSEGLDLQKTLGFGVPQVFNVIITTAEGDPAQIQQNIPYDYMYLINPKISPDGPLALTRTPSFFSIGYISKESPETMAEKFLRILRNYKTVEGIFQGTDKSPETMTMQDFYFGKCAKYQIPLKSKKRILVLGEAAGVVTPVYYEGIVGCLASARIASEILLDLKQQDSVFSAEELHRYDEQLQNRLRNYWKSTQAAEFLFLKSGNNQLTIWNSYLECIKKLPKLRQYIHYAYVCPDLANYPLEHDEWSGEEIFKQLPTASKLLLTPLFLKAKFQ